MNTFDLEKYQRDIDFQRKLNEVCYEIEANAREIKKELQKPRAASIQMRAYLFNRRLEIHTAKGE